MRDITTLNHGVIGNGQVLALVSPSTHIEWLCLPRFDSPSVFARLRDADLGGSFGFDLPGDAEVKMEYVANTNVLQTRVTSADGNFDIFDYAPRVPSGLGVEAPIEIHRVVIPRSGQPHIRVRRVRSRPRSRSRPPCAGRRSGSERRVMAIRPMARRSCSVRRRSLRHR